MQAFVIHCPHKPSESALQWRTADGARADKLAKDKLFRRFLQEHLPDARIATRMCTPAAEKAPKGSSRARGASWRTDLRAELAGVADSHADFGRARATDP